MSECLIFTGQNFTHTTPHRSRSPGAQPNVPSYEYFAGTPGCESAHFLDSQIFNNRSFGPLSSTGGGADRQNFHFRNSGNHRSHASLSFITSGDLAPSPHVSPTATNSPLPWDSPINMIRTLGSLSASFYEVNTSSNNRPSTSSPNGNEIGALDNGRPLAPSQNGNEIGTLGNSRSSTPSHNANKIGAVMLGKHLLPPDMEQTVRAVSQNIKLKPDSKKELRRFSVLSDEEQCIWLGAWILQLHETCDGIDPADSAYNIPKRTQTAIKAAVIKTILDPGLPAYLKPAAITNFTIYLMADSASNYNNIKDNSTKNSAIKASARTKFDRSRSDLKKCPDPDNIVQLCEAIITKLGASTLGHTVTLPLAARIAFLRKVYFDNRDGTGVCGDMYWKQVDEQLEELQRKESREISLTFKETLEEDLKSYGTVHLDGLVLLED
ncbi:hypothetical protein EV359DRAFT_87012 [Lentinula novae-zelandiae]|nr:hypothetical protein EV359DRAFT_87012 [Lentinula novae-zelandiae]